MDLIETMAISGSSMLHSAKSIRACTRIHKQYLYCLTTFNAFSILHHDATSTCHHQYIVTGNQEAPSQTVIAVQSLTYISKLHKNYYVTGGHQQDLLST